MSKLKSMYDNIKVNCTIVSDTHIDQMRIDPWYPRFLLKRALKDTTEALSPVDAFITVGDNTSRGTKTNWEKAKSCYDKYPGIKRILLCLGNHDAWHNKGYDAAMENYYTYFHKITGRKIDTPYFSQVINGYYFIFIGSDSQAGCEAQICDGQMEWFKAEMAKARDSRKPVFVFCHQSLNGKHGLPRTWDRHEDPNADPLDGGIGARSREVQEILKTCEHAFYFSGHSHMGLAGEIMLKNEGYASFENFEGGVELINLPCLEGGNHHGELRRAGMGLQLEVYEDRVLLRPRSYLRAKWETRVNIRDSKPYLEIML